MKRKLLNILTTAFIPYQSSLLIFTLGKSSHFYFIRMDVLLGALHITLTKDAFGQWLMIWFLKERLFNFYEMRCCSRILLLKFLPTSIKDKYGRIRKLCTVLVLLIHSSVLFVYDMQWLMNVYIFLSFSCTPTLRLILCTMCNYFSAFRVTDLVLF